MPKKRKRRLAHHPLFKYFQAKVLIPFLKSLAHLMLATCKKNIIGAEAFLAAAKKEKLIVTLWHNRIFVSPYFFGYLDQSINYTLFVSESRDGAWLSILANSYKNGFTLPVPKDNKFNPLRKFISVIKPNMVGAITPDGPRGPRYKIKPGLIIATHKANAKIVPFTWTASRFWRLNTWDKMIIPKPFSTLTITLGNPLELPSKEEMSYSEQAQLLERTLQEFDRKACSNLY